MDRLLSMRVFQKVIDEGGFAAAARALDMSPAVVTRLVADLETHLGACLLHRTTRRISLSVAGENYLNRVRAILREIDEADSAASAQTQELAGVLRVLAPPLLATYVLGQFIPAFRQLHPKIWLHVEVDSHEHMSIEDYDLTLLSTNEGFNADVIARRVSSTDEVLVCSPDYIKRRGTPSVPEELSEHEVMRLRGPGSHPGVWRLSNSEQPDDIRELSLDSALWINHCETLLQATLAGGGVTAIALDLVAPYLSRGELVRVLRPWIAGRLTMYAALPSRKFMPQRTRVFLDFLTERIRGYQKSAVRACDK